MTAADRLGTYLNGHLAGANAGVATAERLAGRIRTEPTAGTLAQLVADITSDREQLRTIIERLGVSGHPVKEAVGRAAGEASRLVVAEVMTGSEHLTVLLEAETLAMGIHGKLALWEALLAVVPAHPRLAEFDLAALVARAHAQRGRVEEIRLAAVQRSFAVA
jgi:hypothetical protein